MSCILKKGNKLVYSEKVDILSLYKYRTHFYIHQFETKIFYLFICSYSSDVCVAALRFWKSHRKPLSSLSFSDFTFL